MPRREDIKGIIFCNKAGKFIPSFGKSHKTIDNKNIAVIIIKKLLDCLKLLPSELSSLSIVSLFLLLPFVFKNGSNIHITNKIKTIRRTRRNIKISFLFRTTSVSVIKFTTFQKHILPLPNSQLEKSKTTLNPPCPCFSVHDLNFVEYTKNYLYKPSLILKKIIEDLLPFE